MNVRRSVESVGAGLFGLGLILALFLYLPGVTINSMRVMLAQLQWSAFFGIIVGSLLYTVLGALKWHFITGVKGPKRFFYTYYTAQAMMIGQVLPPPVAIAVNRAAVMSLRQKISLGKGLLNALYDMGFDFLIALCLVPVTLAQLVFGFGYALWVGLALAALSLVSVSLVIIPRYFPKSWLTHWPFGEASKKGFLAPRLILVMMVLSSLRIAVVIGRLMLGAVALGLVVPMSSIAYAAPPNTLTSLLILTPGNLGIAEWGWTYLLNLWGVPVAVGAMYGVGFRILSFAGYAVSFGFCWLVYKIANRPN